MNEFTSEMSNINFVLKIPTNLGSSELLVYNL